MIIISTEDQWIVKDLLI